MCFYCRSNLTQISKVGGHSFLDHRKVTRFPEMHTVTKPNFQVPLFFIILPIFWLSFTLNCKREAERDIFLFVSGYTVLYFHYSLWRLSYVIKPTLIESHRPLLGKTLRALGSILQLTCFFGFHHNTVPSSGLSQTCMTFVLWNTKEYIRQKSLSHHSLSLFVLWMVTESVSS